MDVAHALSLYVPCGLEELLHKHALRVGAGGLEEVVEPGVVANDGDAAPTAPVGLLRYDRVAPAGHKVLHLGPAADLLGDTRHRLDANALGQLASADLVPQLAQRVRRRPNPRQARSHDGLGELWAFGEEAVAGVDGGGAGGARELDELVTVHVGLGQRIATECVGLTGRARKRGVEVGVRVADHGVDSQLRSRADHAQGDLGAVGDEDLH